MAIMEAIATTRLEKDAHTITFSSISGYEHLHLKGSLLSTSAAVQEQIHLRFNGDTAANYYYSRLMGYGTTEYCNAGNTTGAGFLGISAAEGVHRRQAYSNLDVTIFDYLNANKNTSVSVMNDYATSATVFGTIMMGGGMWNNTAAVTSITVGQGASVGTFMLRGSVVTLYGIKSS